MRGFTPSTPTRDFIPGPSSGTYSSYLTNNFPLKQVKMAPLCKGSWPTGPEGLSSSLQETRRDPLANANCNIASWMRHWRPPPRAGGNLLPPTGCRASGENEKIAVGKCIFPPLFYRFHCARGAVSLRSSRFMRKQPGSIKLSVAHRVQG